MPVPVSIRDYDPAWPPRFEAARSAITAAVGERLVGIEHIGSTSVPGLAAKPIIDVMPGLRRFEDGHACVAALEALGYVYRGEYGIPGRHYFVSSNSQGRRDQHVHMLVVGSDPWTRHLLFRDYLRAHPAAALEYAALKRALAARHRWDMDAYADSKSGFVEDILARAGLVLGEQPVTSENEP
jgi:GrpB-like predicted nucleotidyltransferase (UPF0157 family)